MSQAKFDIMLIEDDWEDTNQVLAALSDLRPGIHITVVRDGAEALDCIFGTGRYVNSTPYTPRLILLDLRLPKRDGLDVLRVLRSYVRTKVIPVVILSGSVEERKVVESYELGANSVATKPQDPEQFRQLLRQIVAYWVNVNVPQATDLASSPDGQAPSASDGEDVARDTS
jgi:two-component system, response regulator